MNHLRWIVLGVCIGCVGAVGCERSERQRAEDRVDQATERAERRVSQAGEEARRDIDQVGERIEHMGDRHDEARDNDMRMTQTAAAAAQAISAARCEREQRCGNIGPSESYSSEGECMTQVRHDWAQELSAYECPHGVEQAELSECLNQIRQEDCANPFDTLARAVECRSGDICHA